MFNQFGKAVHDQYDEMAKGELFVVNIPDSIDMFARYLESFPAGTNPVFRQRTVHDCNCCKQFIRRLGKVVAIDANYNMVTVWDKCDHLPSPYKEVAAKMAASIRTCTIAGVFRSKERKYGTEYNYDNISNERHDHFYGDVKDAHFHKEPGTPCGEKNNAFQVMSRGLLQIRDSDLQQVLELIDEGQLYKGEEFKAPILGFRELLKAFNEVTLADNRVAFMWANVSNRSAQFRNTVIGTLLVDLAEGRDFEGAVKAFETKVAPTNYKRPTAVITQRMVETATETLNSLELGGAIYRRFAKMTDVVVSDVLFVDNSVNMKDHIAKLLESEVKSAPPDPKHAIPMKADEFIKTIVPMAKKMEVLVENRHVGNFVSLTAPKDDGNYKLFKWDNNFAWSYDGDVTDSVKQRVKAAGGKIECKLRVSLSWFNTDDLDLHAMTPDGQHIYFRDKMGILDVDMNAHTFVRNPVENLAFQTLRNGTYKIYVHNFRKRESTDVGFNIEFEINGVVAQYNHAKAVANNDNVHCFDLNVKDGAIESMKANPALVGGNASKDKWGVKTETLVPVAALMYSPNHWVDGHGIGAKHTIFALKGCLNPEPTRGIYNEYLRGDLDKHRKVFEVLGAKTKCPPTSDQISGVGFTSARGDTVTVVVDGRRSYILSF